MLALIVLLLATLQSAGQIGPVVVPAKQAVVKKGFADRINAYVKLQKNLEGTLPGVKSSNDVEEILKHQQALTAKLVEARRGAKQGDIFTKETSAQLKEIIRKTFKEPGAGNVRRTVRDKDDKGTEKKIVVRVNDVYPEEIPMPTTPPTLLMRLPVLPMELTFRIVGRYLLLQDNKTNLIVDFIPDAIPEDF